jgi:cytochrome c oxidase subunit 1
LSDCCKKQRLQSRRVPAALSGFALWLTLMIALTVINYGYPIAQLLRSI